MSLPNSPLRSASFRPHPGTGYDRPHEEGVVFRNTWLMVVERKWYALTGFLVVALAVATYTLMTTPLYEGVATIQVLKRGSQVLRVADVVESSITNESDFNTQMKVLESLMIVKNVVGRLTPEETKQLTDPYRTRSGETRGAADIVAQNRRIQPQRMSLIVAIRFTHPDPKIAARVANLIASEYIGYNTRLRVEESMKAVDEIKDRAEQQRRRVEEIANALQTFRQRGNLISLVQNKDIVTERLKALNMMATQTNARLKEAEIRWQQVDARRKAARDLTELPFIAAHAKVAQLTLQVTQLGLAFDQVRLRYKENHPRFKESAQALLRAQQEQGAAIELAAASVRAEYEAALRNDEEARKALAEQEARSLELDKAGVEHENMSRDFRVNDQLLESMLTRMRETSVNGGIETESARIIDRAFEPAKPILPRLGQNIALGLIGGLFFGFAVAYAVATIDDRVKTAFDVERIIGVPLVGVIPKVGQMEQADKAQIVINGGSGLVVEAFRSIYSNLRLGENSKNARLLLVTGTLSGEGKSFVATNLALTFALQGKRTAVVDCDLRRPNLQRSFRLPIGKGVVGYCLHGAKLDEILFRNVYPNLDVVTVGGRVSNPLQVLGSKEFESLVTELSARYDRVVFDTPPLGIVSDALNILPLMDGALYTIRFNAVKRRAAQRCMRRLHSTNVPVFGAVLNAMNTGMTGGYYVKDEDRMLNEYFEPATGRPKAAAAK
jgi:succinoglycan biosynthesis transport protein ExoP